MGFFTVPFHPLFQPLDDYVRNVTGSVSYVIPMCAHAPWFGYVTSATTAPTRVAVLSAEGQECQMPTTARNAL